MRIATAQNRILGDPKANGREIRELMCMARDAGAELIHFPEGAISGYVKSQIRSWEEVNWELLRKEIEKTAALAGNLGLWVVLGSNHRLSQPNRPHNSLYIFSPDGELHTRYDKQLCSNSEINDWYTPGRENVVFDVSGWRFGCSLCIEIQFPELFLEYERQAIDCMLFSSFSESEMFRIQAQAYAAINNYWFSFSVPTQCSANAPSSMIGPSGEIVSSCHPVESGFTISTLDRDAPEWEVAIKRARPWRRLARTGDIYETKHVNDSRSRARHVF